jgi:Antibiotic biosynthesis monooxygenase
MNADGTGQMRVREDATDDGVGARHAAGDGVMRDTPQAMGSGLAVQQGSSVRDTSARFCVPAEPGFVICGLAAERELRPPAAFHPRQPVVCRARPSSRRTREGVIVVSRVNFLDTAPDGIDDVARVVREIVHPGIRDEAGYVGYVVLGDPETGRALGVTMWESSEAREASDAKARQIRPRVEQETGGTMRAVESYDVLFFDFRGK